jgi:hypothetical protein
VAKGEEGGEAMNEANYGSLEACQRLFSAGIAMETEFYWELNVGPHNSDVWILGHRLNSRGKRIPALSMAEVWRELPDHLDSPLSDLVVTKDSIGITSCFYKVGHEFDSPNPTDALIDLLIWTAQRKEEKG